MTVAAFVVSILAVLVAGGALWYVRGQKIVADRAADIADAALKLGQAAERRAKEAEDRTRVAWALEHISGMQYVLHNHGTESAYDVHVELGDFQLRGGGEEDFTEFPADHAESYHFGRGIDSTQTSVSVTWRLQGDPSSERRQQRLVVTF
jgi:hypothetical protein